MCDNSSIYIDGACIRKQTVVINHLITNQIDAFHCLGMFVIIFVLYFYQCTKINKYARKNNKYIQFQVLFFILTSLRIMELSYAYLGYVINQSNEWKIDGKKLIYCDPSFKYEKVDYCYERYEINGIFLNTYFYLGTITLQMISFFWYLYYFNFIITLQAEVDISFNVFIHL